MNFSTDIIEQLNIGIIIVDQEFSIIMWNHWMKEVMGKESEEVRGHSIVEYSPPLKALYQKYIKKTLTNQQTVFLSGALHPTFFMNPTNRSNKKQNLIIQPIILEERECILIQVFDVTSQYQQIKLLKKAIKERREAEEELRYTVFHDTLTGLYNRNYFEEEINKLNQHGLIPISIIVADVNGLKIVNDTFGHDRGDQYLKRVSTIIKQSCRRGDRIARWGGDEFIILLNQTTGIEAERICDRIKENCSQDPNELESISIALGYAVKESLEENLLDVLKNAEEMMYKNKLTENRSAKGALLTTVLKTLGAKSHETEEHAWRLQKMALAIGEEIGLPPYELDRLSLLVPLHDIGKISIPEEILTKTNRLSEEEWEIIQLHSEKGCQIAQSTGAFAHIANDILAHHERWDGKGYPNGLKGEDIPILSRITAIVDSYDAMTNKRPYSMPKTKEDALQEIIVCSGTQFDPTLVDVFVSIIKSEALLFEESM